MYILSYKDLMYSLYEQTSDYLHHLITLCSVLSAPQAVDIHKEKVARREIGSLANSKNITRAQKVVAPTQKERQQKHIRSHIDFNSLDHIGHGVRTGSSSNLPERFSGAAPEVLYM